MIPRTIASCRRFTQISGPSTEGITRRSSPGEVFSGRVVTLFGAELVAAALGVLNGILLARLLGPAGKGDYYLLIFVPTTVMVLVQLGLPRAFLFFSARGQTAGMLARAFALTVVLSTAALFVVSLLLPVLRDTLLRGFESRQMLISFIVLPLALSATFTTAILVGRQAVRWFVGIRVIHPILTLALIVVILGGLEASVNAAIAVYLIALSIQIAGLAIGARRATARIVGAGAASYRELLGYGLPYYPGSLSQFFGLRVDAYLIAFLIADPSEALGYYTMAVALAEMVLFFPRAVDTLFSPHVAGSAREDSDRQVARVFRVTLLAATVFAVALVPATLALITFFLPAFDRSIPAFLVLLPGIVLLSSSNVLGGYVAGIGRPGAVSVVSLAALAANVVANIVLIPRIGIVGASAASLISYSLSALLLIAIAARLTATPVVRFATPRASDVRFAVAAGIGVIRRLRAGSGTAAM